MDTPAIEWMTTQQLADWLQVSVSTIYDWRAQGMGPLAYRIGRHLRWRREDVMEWLMDQAA